MPRAINQTTITLLNVFGMDYLNELKEYISGHYNPFRIGNDKVGRNCGTMNFPPIVTCNPNAPCFKICYGTKGAFNWQCNKDKMMESYELFMDRPQFWFDLIKLGLIENKLPYHRWMANGDIPNELFLDKAFKLAMELPNVHFLLMTKQHEIVNSYLDTHQQLPNFEILFSGCRDWEFDNRHNLPMTHIRFKDFEPREYLSPTVQIVECYSNSHHEKDDCDKCGHKCWYLKPNECVVFDEH